MLPLVLGKLKVLEERPDLDIEFTLRNSGPNTFELPVARDGNTIHADGNVGRKTGVYSLSLDNNGEPSRSTIIFVVSSKSVKSSFVALKPGESVLVKLRATKIIGAGEQAPANATLSYMEYESEDSRYFINRRSYDVVSQKVSVSRYNLP